MQSRRLAGVAAASSARTAEPSPASRGRSQVQPAGGRHHSACYVGWFGARSCAWLRRHPRLVDGALALLLAALGIGIYKLDAQTLLTIPLVLGMVGPVVFRREHPVGSLHPGHHRRRAAGAVRRAGQLRPLCPGSCCTRWPPTGPGGHRCWAWPSACSARPPLCICAGIRPMSATGCTRLAWTRPCSAARRCWPGCSATPTRWAARLLPRRSRSGPPAWNGSATRNPGRGGGGAGADRPRAARRRRAQRQRHGGAGRRGRVRARRVAGEGRRGADRDLPRPAGGRPRRDAVSLLGVLRNSVASDPPAGPANLTLARSLAWNSSPSCSSRPARPGCRSRSPWKGVPRAVPSGAALAAYRNGVQESLTNARKHGGSRR